MNKLVVCILASLIFLSASSAFAAPPKKAKEAKTEAVKSERITTLLWYCAACHGKDGNGPTPPNPEYPKIAGKSQEYLEKQLTDFQSEKRKNTIMAGWVAELSPAEITTIASYYAKQGSTPDTGKNPELLAAGKKFYAEGNPERGVPACAGCHLPDGSGASTFAALAGQHAAYLYQQLKRFASSERTNDAGMMMQSVATAMTDEEMRAVSEYIASMNKPLKEGSAP